MRILRRVLTTIVVTLAVILACIYWIAPVALSFYAARKVPAIARIVPTDLRDNSVSQSPGIKLSYLGYEFEVPWSDLDEAKTTLYPKEKPEKTRAVLSFRSGLRLSVTALPPREFAKLFATDFEVPRQNFDTFFGSGKTASDYAFVRSVYEFAPQNMRHWAWSPRVHAREMTLLVTKSMVLTKPAETGIFIVQNPSYRGFQQGDPQIRQDWLLVNLYSDDGGLEIAFLQNDYHNPTGVTQPEINRIVQSVHRATPIEQQPLQSRRPS